MMLTQCIGFANFSLCRVAQIGHLMVLCDALLALVVDHVAPALDERGFAQIAQVVVPFDAQLVVLGEHVAPALDECGFAHGAAQIAIPYVVCALEASCSHLVPLQLALPVDPRANGTHFVELVKHCVFEKHRIDVVI